MKKYLGIAIVLTIASVASADPLADASRAVVKLYGAGGFGRVESYQTAVQVEGLPLALTAETTLLDSDSLIAIGDNGVRHEVSVVRIDRRLGIAWLDLGLISERKPRLAVRPPTSPIENGEPVFVISNAFGVATGTEALSVQTGVVMTQMTAGKLQLETVAGASPLPASTPLVLLDVVCSNPGAAGGAVIDREGRLLALVGAERRSATVGGWLNYAVPAGTILDATQKSTADDDDAEPIVTVRDPFGIVFTPPVDETVPPYVTHLRPGSVALKAGLLPDDLVVAIRARTVSTRSEAMRELSRAYYTGGVFGLEVLRGEELLTIRLSKASSQ